MDVFNPIFNSTATGVPPSEYLSEQPLLGDWRRGGVDWGIYNLAQGLREEMEDLRRLHGDAVYAAIKEAGFEDKVIKMIKKIIDKKEEQFDKGLKESIISFEKEKEKLKKDIDELTKEVRNSTALLTHIKAIAKELDYQLDIAHKSF